MKQGILTAAWPVAALAAIIGFTTIPSFAGNPSGTGQPNQSCGSATATVQPNGFGTKGFTHAAKVYAGSPGSKSATHSKSTKSVSQYDVACFQKTQHRPMTRTSSSPRPRRT